MSDADDLRVHDSELTWESFATAIQNRLYAGADEYDQAALWWNDGVIATYGGTSEGERRS